MSHKWTVVEEQTIFGDNHWQEYTDTHRYIDIYIHKYTVRFVLQITESSAQCLHYFKWLAKWHAMHKCVVVSIEWIYKMYKS